MKWYALNKEYVQYLKQFDTFVPNINYTGRLKCFIGIVFTDKSGINYFAPLTSYKPKFINMSNGIDFLKIQNEYGKIYGAIDINNMIPVPTSEYNEITFKNLPDFRNFTNRKEQKDYWKLLNKELSCLNKQALLDNAEKLYRIFINNPNSNLAQRCCNFPLLEEKCIEYERVDNIIQDLNNIANKEDLYYIYDNLDDLNDFENIVFTLDDMLNSQEINIQDLTPEEINTLLVGEEPEDEDEEEW